MLDVIVELKWSYALLVSLGASPNTPIHLCFGNLVFHEHTKHIEVDCHYVSYVVYLSPNNLKIYLP